MPLADSLVAREATDMTAARLCALGVPIQSAVSVQRGDDVIALVRRACRMAGLTGELEPDMVELGHGVLPLNRLPIPTPAGTGPHPLCYGTTPGTHLRFRQVPVILSMTLARRVRT
jgi:hypothetical protein